jgi:hypothetical protein
MRKLLRIVGLTLFTFLAIVGGIVLLGALASNAKPPVVKPSGTWVIVCNNGRGTAYLTNDNGKVSGTLDIRQAAVFDRAGAERALDKLQSAAAEKGMNPEEFTLVQLAP